MISLNLVKNFLNGDIDSENFDASAIDKVALFKSAQKQLVEKIKSAKENFRVEIIVLSIKVEAENLLCEIFTVEEGQYKKLSNFRLFNMLISQGEMSMIQSLAVGKGKEKLDEIMNEVPKTIIGNMTDYATQSNIDNMRILGYQNGENVKFIVADDFKKVCDINVEDFLKNEL